MAEPNKTPAGSEPIPPPQSAPLPSNVVTYRNPRRTSPENSITLRHHRMARDNSKRNLAANVPAAPHPTHIPRRKSSGESNDTGLSDGRKWFDRTNQNLKGNLDTSGMDVDPPFFQRETDSSNEEGVGHLVPSQSPAYRFVQNQPTTRQPGFTQSSSAGDYRSVIDDLTIENKRLKEELKKYRQPGPDSLRRDKLFEVKVHGLPTRKKRELEAALRDFTAGLDGSSTGESASRRKGHGKSRNIHSSSGGLSKHASSSSGSNSRPVDSAYASMSGTGGTSATGTNSTTPSMMHLSKAAKQRSNSKIENYLRDIPEGLWPQATFMTEKDKKKWVVKRLEHLFTGKMTSQNTPSQVPAVPAPIAEDAETGTKTSTGTSEGNIAEASREAKIRPRESQHHGAHSRNAGSASNEHSHSDQADSRDVSGSGSGGSEGKNTSPPQEFPDAEQRATRPRDLDPDRRQIPSDNMDYIRHLGLVAPESQKEYSNKDVSPDAEGWVYLNLLCNLAQLHMLSVTPDFIRSAVTEKSTKFQLSPDGRKIRWRGGEDGTKFSSDSSGRDSQKSQSSDDTDGSNDQDQRKKQKTHQTLTSNDVISQNPTNLQPQNQERQASNSSKSFHYKPLFVHHNTSSSDEQPSAEDETGSSYGAEESNLGPNSRWGQSGTSGLSRRKRRRDGAIIYYSGAPFCTDLSGDFGPNTDEMTSSDDQGPLSLNIHRPGLDRSTSGSTIPFRPLSGPSSYVANMDLDDSSEPPELTSGETDYDEIEANFEWSDSQQQEAPLINLEASGLAGIYPEDHFVVVVTTKRPTSPQVYDGSDDGSSVVGSSRPKVFQHLSHDTTDSNITEDTIAYKLAAMSTESPRPWYASKPRKASPNMVRIHYVSDQTHRLTPVPLPPPAFFYGSSGSELDDDSDDDDLSGGFLSRHAMVEDDGLSSPQEDLSGSDEEDEHSDGGDGLGYGDTSGSGSLHIINNNNTTMRKSPAVPMVRSRSGPPKSALSKKTGSSAATAGGAPSGDYSSMEEV